MSTKYTTAIIGLAAPGVLGFCATFVAWGQDIPGAPAASPAAPAAAPSSAAAPTEAVLLLTNGQVQQGELSRDDSGYSLRVRGGTLRFKRREVERDFPSMRELYEYKCAQIPRQDPDELMKLAQWCLQQRLDAEAGEQLEAVLEIVPGHRKAQAMLSNLRAQLASRARNEADGAMAAPLDPSLRRTEAVVHAKGLEPLSQQEIRRTLRAMGDRDVPVIFDLPPVQAVRQASEFNQYVHPVLQRICAGCHNEKYNGSFQMIQVKLERDLKNPEIRRQNLDATLSLVSPENLSQSPLLSNALLPHGTNKKVILRGPNDPLYRALSTWVMKMQPPRVADPRMARSAGGGFAGRGDGMGPAGSPSGGFGASRFDETPGMPDPSSPPLSAVVDPYQGEVPGVPNPPPRAKLVPQGVNSLVPNSYSGGDPTGQGATFPANPLIGGVPSSLPTLPNGPISGTAGPRPKAPAAEAPADPTGTAEGAPLPLDDLDDAPPIPAPVVQAAKKLRPSKKIDPALLGRILKNSQPK